MLCDWIAAPIVISVLGLVYLIQYDIRTAWLMLAIGGIGIVRSLAETGFAKDQA